MYISSDEQKAARLGTVVSGNVIGFALGPIIGGFLMDKAIFGEHISLQAPFYISAGMGLVGAILLFFFKETYVGDKTIKIHILTVFKIFITHLAIPKPLGIVLPCYAFLFGWGIYHHTGTLNRTTTMGRLICELLYLICWHYVCHCNFVYPAENNC